MQDLTKTTVPLVNAAKLLLKKEDDLYTNKMYPKNKWNNYVIVVGRVSPYKLDPALDRGSGVKYATKRPHLFSLISIKCQRKIRDRFFSAGRQHSFGKILNGFHSPTIPTGDSLFVSRTGFITWANMEKIWGEIVYYVGKMKETIFPETSCAY